MPLPLLTLHADEPPAPPRPILATALALVAGMAIGLAFPWPWWVWGWLTVLPAGATLVFLLRSRRIRGPEPPTGNLLLVATLGIGCLLGSGLERGDRQALARIPAWADEALVRVEGTLDEEPRLGQQSVELVLRDARVTSMRAGGSSASFPGRLALRVYDAAARPLLAPRSATLPLPGQRLRAWGRFHRTDIAQTTPNPFDSWRYWRSRGVLGRLAVIQPGDLDLGPRPVGAWPGALAALRATRGWMAGNMAAHLRGEELALARALLLGEAGLLSLDRREEFARIGLAHLLAVSGMNTGYVLLVLLALARLCLLSPRAGAWVGIVGLIGYTALTGFQPPVVRAATMGAFIMLGFALGRFTTSLSSLATATFLTLLLSPRNLLRLDWQLSYACALSIILLAPPLYELVALKKRGDPSKPVQNQPTPAWYRTFERLLLFLLLPLVLFKVDRHQWIPACCRTINQWLLLPLAVVVAVQLGLMPIQWCYFQRFSVWTPLANLVGVPLTMFAFIGAMATAVVGRIPLLGIVAGAPTHWCLAALTSTVSFFNTLPLAAVNLRPLPLWLIATYYLLLLGTAGLLTGRARFLLLDVRQRASLAIRIAACCALLAVAPLLVGARGGWLDFYMLDVGQGDSLVARFPNGRVMVIDAGNPAPADQGRLTVSPFLRALGIDRIDCLLATHFDADHVGGMPYLLDQFDVGVLVAGPDPATSKEFQDLEQAVRRHAVPVIPIRPGERLEGFGEVTVRVLGAARGKKGNDASVVLLLDDRAVQILAVGDLEATGERQLLAQGVLPDVEALKVGHHGSRTSTSEAFLAAVRPEVALISVGRHSRYGHPVPEVIDRLRRHGILVCRTDLLGTIWLRSDGRWLETLAFASPD
jgi:competence protein ComEC